ncbi:MAG: replication protein [Anaplasmataceae bacterium]|nr:replication protein [Anaplasmataceae bacterium]
MKNPAPEPSRVSNRILDTSDEIINNQPEKIDFLHTVLCQVGMPRKKTEGRIFERESGRSIIRLESGALFDGNTLVEQPLPYGSRPRLVMVHLSSEAMRTQSRKVEIGNSTREFLKKLEIGISGGKTGSYTMFQKQMQALAACRMTLGMSVGGRNVTLKTQPISRFEAWLHNHDTAQLSLWPGVLELSKEFFDTLNEHAVPLDSRALSALKHSALALDVYTWLAYRLCRVDREPGVKVSWINLKDQFGQEYGDIKDFRKEFRNALSQVVLVYPEARLEQIDDGFILKSSPPPIQKIQVIMPIK